MELVHLLLVRKNIQKININVKSIEMIVQNDVFFLKGEVDGLDKNEATQLEGWLDTSFLFSYAFFMFIR